MIYSLLAFSCFVHYYCTLVLVLLTPVLVFKFTKRHTEFYSHSLLHDDKLFMNLSLVIHNFQCVQGFNSLTIHCKLIAKSGRGICAKFSNQTYRTETFFRSIWKTIEVVGRDTVFFVQTVKGKFSQIAPTFHCSACLEFQVKRK